MAARHVAATVAALNLAAIPFHLRGQQAPKPADTAPAQASGAAPQGATQRAAEPGFSWDEVVAEVNRSTGAAR